MFNIQYIEGVVLFKIYSHNCSYIARCINLYTITFLHTRTTILYFGVYFLFRGASLSNYTMVRSLCFCTVNLEFVSIRIINVIIYVLPRLIYEKEILPFYTNHL